MPAFEDIALTAGAGPTTHELFRKGSSGPWQPVVRGVSAESIEAGGALAAVASDTVLFSANIARFLVGIENNTGGDIYLRFDATAVTAANYQMRIPSGILRVFDDGLCPLPWRWMCQIATGDIHYFSAVNGA